MGRSKKRTAGTRQHSAKPPRIKGPIRVTDERAEWPVPPPHTWTTEESLAYKERLARGETVALYRSQDGRTTTVAGAFYGPDTPASAKAEAKALLAAVQADRRRLHRGGGRRPGVDALGQALRDAGVHRDENAALKWLRDRMRNDAKLPLEERLILTVSPNRAIHWQDERGRQHTTRLRDRLRSL